VFVRWIFNNVSNVCDTEVLLFYLHMYWNVVKQPIRILIQIYNVLIKFDDRSIHILILFKLIYSINSAERKFATCIPRETTERENKWCDIYYIFYILESLWPYSSNIMRVNQDRCTYSMQLLKFYEPDLNFFLFLLLNYSRRNALTQFSMCLANDQLHYSHFLVGITWLIAVGYP